jgi:hypothetical protein
MVPGASLVIVLRIALFVICSLPRLSTPHSFMIRLPMSRWLIISFRLSAVVTTGDGDDGGVVFATGEPSVMRYVP